MKKSVDENMKKEYSMQYAFLSIVLLGMFLLAFFVGGVSLYEMDRFIQSSTKDFIIEKCEKEAAQINGIFADMEKSVRIMESYILDFISSEEDLLSANVQDELINQSGELFAEVAKNTSGTVAYYIRFAPEISTEFGLFCSKEKGEQHFVRVPNTDISRYPKTDREHVGWYWEPYEAGTAIWLTPYYNKNIDVTMISFVIPMYYQDRFFGVVGMDFDYSILKEKIQNIRIYENGYAHLELDGKVLQHDANLTEDSKPVLHPKDLRVSSKLYNGMDLVVTADYNDIREIRYGVLLKLAIIVTVFTIVSALIVGFLVRRIARPLKTLTEAAGKLANNDYDIDIGYGNIKEIKQLNTMFQHMIEQLRERDVLQQMLAYRDSLTGLRNTTAYKTWVSNFEKELQANAVEFGVAVLDINYLKKINDNYGHEMGNKLIVTASKIIADTFKRSPVFRIGGDEFCVILQNRDLQEYDTLIKKLYAYCDDEPITSGEPRSYVSIASGCAMYNPLTDHNFTDVFNRADDTMYENKRKMKGCVDSNP